MGTDLSVVYSLTDMETWRLYFDYSKVNNTYGSKMSLNIINEITYYIIGSEILHIMWLAFYLFACELMTDCTFR